MESVTELMLSPWKEVPRIISLELHCFYLHYTSLYSFLVWPTGLLTQTKGA